MYSVCAVLFAVFLALSISFVFFPIWNHLSPPLQTSHGELRSDNVHRQQARVRDHQLCLYPAVWSGRRQPGEQSA